MLIEKYHGCGNDFLITDYVENYDLSKLSIKACDRHTGIGADGMIFLKKDPLEMVFYNQDGTLAPMCGNGIRCFSLYAINHGVVTTDDFEVLTGAGEMKISVANRNPFKVRVNMGEPVFGPEKIGFTPNEDPFGYPFLINNQERTLYSFFMGTIHTIVFTDNAERDIQSNLGELISENAIFAYKTNVNFVQVVDRNTLIVRTYERGAGRTLACGTGATAAAVCANKLGIIDKICDVKIALGTLKIETGKTCFMTGPAEKICEINYEVK